MPIKIVDTKGMAVNPGPTKQNYNPVKKVTRVPVKMTRFHVKTKGGVIYGNT